MRYYIIAGERSGDLHGSNLVKALQKKDSEAVLKGFGGEYMQQVGVNLTVHYRDLAFMGFVEILFNLNKIFQYIKLCKRDIDSFKPDVIILIDYGGFNRKIAKYGKDRGIKVFYYIPPKLWAWNQGRAKEIKANVDKLFVILPFETDFYRKYDWEVDYVGNPVLDAIKSHEPDDNFRETHGLYTEKPIIALLPGSRKQELLKIIPLMAEVIKRKPNYHFAIAAIDNLNQDLYAPLNGLSNVSFIYNKTFDLLSCARAAIVTSGTATLETALFKVPQVVVYKPGALTYWLVKMLIKVPYISLVNLIANREVVKELIHHDASVSKVTHELDRLIEGSGREQILSGYQEIIDKLEAGGSASENTANLMWKYLTIS